MVPSKFLHLLKSPVPPPHPVPIILLKWFIPKLYACMVIWQITVPRLENLRGWVQYTKVLYSRVCLLGKITVLSLNKTMNIAVI